MTKKEAQAQGRKLARSLGKGWRSHIWHNLSWHYCAVFGKERPRIGDLKIVASFAYIANVFTHYGACLGGKYGQGKTAGEAMEDLFGQFQKEAADATAAIETLIEAFPD
jgi:hypothetical protein